MCVVKTTDPHTLVDNQKTILHTLKVHKVDYAHSNVSKYKGYDKTTIPYNAVRYLYRAVQQLDGAQVLSNSASTWLLPSSQAVQ